MDPILERYQALEDKIKEYNPALDAQRLFRAFTYADNAHAGQLRKDGSPYITHPLAVAEIVAELELDTDSIIAALLHDCIEDTGATHEEIAKLFGPTVADLVEGVTKLTRVQYTSKEEEQMENLRKMLMAMAKDIRVILIKICDRLHNMRTMGVPERPQAEGEGPGNHGDLCAHRPPPGHAAHQVGAGGHLPAIPGSHRLQGDCRRAGRPLLRP